MAPIKRFPVFLTSPLGTLLLAFTLALLCGLFVEGRALAIAATIAVMIGIGSVYPFLALRSVSGELTFANPRISEGERGEAVLSLHNRLPLAVWGIGIGGITPDTTGDGGCGHLTLPPGRHTFRFPLSDLGRGVYPNSVPHLVCGFPFGLVLARRPLRCQAELLVWPRTYVAPEIPVSARQGEAEGSLAARKAGDGGDIIGVRDFRRGDSLRRIHWAQTARQDRLIVTERHAMRLPVIHITLDLTGAGEGAESPREFAIRTAATLIEGWQGGGARIELILRDGAARRLQGGTPALLDALARLPRSAPATSPPSTGYAHLSRGADAAISIWITTAASPFLPAAEFIFLAGGPDTAARLRQGWTASRGRSQATSGVRHG